MISDPDCHLQEYDGPKLDIPRNITKSQINLNIFYKAFSGLGDILKNQEGGEKKNVDLNRAQCQSVNTDEEGHRIFLEPMMIRSQESCPSQCEGAEPECPH